MRKITLLALLIIVGSCGAKRTERRLGSGDYDGAIDIAVSSLRNNKDKKGKQDYVVYLEDAYTKAKQRDLQEIDLLAKDANPRNLERIFVLYRQLHDRQESIKPLLPLKIASENRNANFTFDDYSEQLVNSKDALSSYLYNNSRALVMTNDKKTNRRAYDDLAYLEQINPGYKDVSQLMDQAKHKGSNYVSVYLKNETNMAIPKRLENDLLDFSTYGLDDEWTVYHSNRIQGINYDYGVVVNFRQINISAEEIHEREIPFEKEINFGKKKKLDRRGSVVRDSLGQPIMVDDIRIVRATVREYRQFKATQVTAKVDYINFNTNQLLQTFPLSSEFVFESIYAKVKGDRRAVDENYLVNLDRRAVPFPTTEQMVYDTGEDLKAKLKNILLRNRIGY